MKTTPSSTRNWPERCADAIIDLSCANGGHPNLSTNEVAEIIRSHAPTIERFCGRCRAEQGKELRPPRTCEAPGERGTLCLSEPGHNGQHLFGKPTGTPHPEEIARNVARQFIHQTIHTLHSSDDTPLLVRLIQQAYAPLYEQKEELVRVLREMNGICHSSLVHPYDPRAHKSYCRACGATWDEAGETEHTSECRIGKAVREAEAALEKAQK